MKTAFTFKIGGEAGFGVMSAGLTFSKIATRSGYYIYDYTEYPSLIRGGHNVMQVSVFDKVVRSQFITTDFLVALNQETIELHKHELPAGSGLLYDSDAKGIDISNVPEGVNLFPIPLTTLAVNNNGTLIMRNTIALGATLALLSGNMKILKALIKESFGEKKQELVDINCHVAEEGYKYVKDKYASFIKEVLKPKDNVEKKAVITGNEAIAFGAIAAGMQFTAIYPMTPTSNILHALSPLQEKFKFIYKQPEDEISAINMAIGASYAGARTMVATSGGGFALMSEAYGLAGITETPVVIIEGMRGAPATGLPTWSEQGDLRFVLHAHQGDFPRIILTPGDIEECFHMTMEAFNLADKYQTPVLVLVDKNVLESHMSVPFFDTSSFEIERGKYTTELVPDYQRYAPSEDGISIRSIPGTGNHFVSNSDEHDVYGYSSESSSNRISQMNKRMTKLKTCAERDMPVPKLYGDKKATTTIVSWGSNKGAILEALPYLPDTNYLHLTWVNPFPRDFVSEVLYKAKRVINVECNFSAQMGGIIKEQTGFGNFENLLKYDGRPFYPHEIIERVLGTNDY